MMSSTSPKQSPSTGTPAGAPPAVATLQTIHAPKPSEVLAAHIRSRILDGSLSDGDTLPAERDLVAQTGLTRGGVREALRILHAEGLVETHAGRFGGSVVRRPSDDALAKYLGLFIQGRSISMHSLLQVRETMGGPIAALAAASRTDDDIARLTEIGRRIEEAFDDPPTFLRENVNWQVALATATGNELLQAFMTAISSLLLQQTTIENYASEDIRRVAIKAHARILEAIVKGDAETASRRMSRHMASTTRHTKSIPSAPLKFE